MLHGPPKLAHDFSADWLDYHRLNSDRAVPATSYQFLPALDGAVSIGTPNRIYISQIYVTNYTVSNRLFTMRIIQKTAGKAGVGGVNDDATSDVIHAASVVAGDTWIIEWNSYLEAGDILKAFADAANALSIYIVGGVER